MKEKKEFSPRSTLDRDSFKYRTQKKVQEDATKQRTHFILADLRGREKRWEYVI